jgi:hypothetical protein
MDTCDARQHHAGGRAPVGFRFLRPGVYVGLARGS